MSRRLLFFVGGISMCLTLGGCWSSSEIQSVTYAKAIGIDYRDGYYHAYVQAIDFASVAKTDSSGKANESPGIWIGHGRGKTLNLALNNIFSTAQLHIAWGHVTAAVLSESILNSGKVGDVLDMVNRFPESRYTSWVFGTRMPMDKLFAIPSLFNMSPLDSILHNPMPSYKEKSLLPPLQSMTFMANQHEKSALTYLPSLSYNDQNWNRLDKPHELLVIDGAFFNRDNIIHDYMPVGELFGFALMQPQMRRAPLYIEKDGDPIGTISIGLPKIKIKSVASGEQVKFRIKATYMGSLYEYLSPLPYNEMTELAANTIKERIMATYLEAVKRGIDVYGLENRLYRKDPALWRKLSNNGEVTLLNENSIESLEVRVRVIYNGKYKRIAGG